MIYGVYSNDALVHWPPSKIFVDEIRVSNQTSDRSYAICEGPPSATCCLHEMTNNHFPQIIGSFAQMHCFPRAVAYLDSGRIKVKGMVSVVLFH